MKSTIDWEMRSKMASENGKLFPEPGQAAPVHQNPRITETEVQT